MFAASKTASVSGGYQISRSLRFNSADSAYLNRTVSSASNRQTWTWSAWLKRSALGSFQSLFGAPSSSLAEVIAFSATDQIVFYSDALSAGGMVRASTAVYRDPSAWYHVVVTLDTTNATAQSRCRIWINGTEVTAWDTNATITQNASGYIDSAVTHTLARNPASATQYFNGYMTEVNFIDGQALTPSSFGQTDAQTGVWTPKAYSGSYGTNGFYLNFSDNSNTTAATLGKDYSGNGNNWTPNNFSVTAGAGNDSLVDSPTSYGTDTGVGGTVRGNYATLNPLNKPTNIVLANGNLQATNSVGTIENVRSTMPTASTYSYWEVTTSVVGSSLRLDLGGILSSYVQSVSNTAYLADTGPTGTFGATWNTGLKFWINNTNVYSSGTANLVANDVIMFAHDSSTGKIWLGLNGTFYNSGNPAAGTGNVGTLTADSVFPAAMVNGGGGANGVYFNFGQRPFAYTAPSGFKALCTQNLPTPAIGATSTTLATSYFAPALYTGTNATQSITTGFQPDLVWIKSRSQVSRNTIFDAVRGVTKVLWSDSTDAEGTASAGTGLTSLNSNGFTLGTEISGTSGSTNVSGVTYVAWNWKANGSGSTNTAGQITSTVSANTTSGFSIVTFTTDGTTKTVGHGLGVKPSLIIAKVRNGVGSWIAMTDIINGSMQYSTLNSTAAFASIGYSAPTSTVFQYNDNNGNTQVAYCFASIEGYSKIGTYTGNGSSSGPFVFCNFRPAYLLVKRTDAINGDWTVWDNKRNTYNPEANTLSPNQSAAEYVSAASNGIDFVSNGFRVIGTDSGINGSGGTYIFAAFAESPFKYSLAR